MSLSIVIRERAEIRNSLYPLSFLLPTTRFSLCLSPLPSSRVRDSSSGFTWIPGSTEDYTFKYTTVHESEPKIRQFSNIVFKCITAEVDYVKSICELLIKIARK
jgi:hypothetical protein